MGAGVRMVLSAADWPTPGCLPAYKLGSAAVSLAPFLLPIIKSFQPKARIACCVVLGTHFLHHEMLFCNSLYIIPSSFMYLSSFSASRSANQIAYYACSLRDTKQFYILNIYYLSRFIFLLSLTLLFGCSNL